MDLGDLEYVQSTLKLLGSKGTTGTQASFLELFNGDQETIDKIDPMIAEKMGFKLDKQFILRSKKETYGYSCLTNQKQYYMENYPKIAIEKGTIDEVITMMIRGTEQ